MTRLRTATLTEPAKDELDAERRVGEYVPDVKSKLGIEIPLLSLHPSRRV